MSSAFGDEDNVQGGPTAYRVLARKYRPKDFSDLIGQEAMVQTLSNAFETSRIAQAYMLTGVRGVGKTTTARILARALNYQTEASDQPNIDLSEDGIHCPMILEGRHPDVLEMDAASNTGIDDIRDLISSAQYAPTSARYKVFIIDEVHMLSKAAFNGLLKTLEEPPSHVKFIFATTEIRKVPVTVLSRCQRFDLRRIAADLLASHMKTGSGSEGGSITAEAAALIARAGEGSARDALSILDQAIAHATGEVQADAVRTMLGLADRTRIIDLFEQIMGGDIASALGELKAQYDVGADPSVVLADLATFTHFATRLKFVPQAAEDASVSEEERTRGLALSQKLSTRVLGRAWQMLLKGGQEVSMARDPLAAAEMVLIRLAHASDLPSPEQAIDQLKHLANNPPADSTPAGGGNGASSENGAPSGIAGGATQAISQSTIGATGTLGAEPTAYQAPSTTAETEAQQQPYTKPQLAVSNPEPQASAQADMSKSVDLSQFKNLTDLVKLAEKNRDLRLKNALRNDVRLVRFAPPSLNVALTDTADHTVVQLISEQLSKITGTRWMVSTSNEAGEPSLGEQEKQARSQQLSEAESNPTVAALMSAFPGSKIVDVRLREDIEDTGLAPVEEDTDAEQDLPTNFDDD